MYTIGSSETLSCTSEKFLGSLPSIATKLYCFLYFAAALLNIGKNLMHNPHLCVWIKSTVGFELSKCSFLSSKVTAMFVSFM